MYQVIYHKGCNDGVFAAAALYHLTALGANDIYTPGSHDHMASRDNFNEIISEEEKLAGFVFVDIAPSPELTKDLLETGFKVIILDHHKTTRVEFLKADQALLSHPKLRIMVYQPLSGAALAYVVSTSLRIFGCKHIAEFMFKTALTPVDEAGAYGNWNIRGLLPENILSLAGLNRLYYLICVRDIWLTENPADKAAADGLNAWLVANNVHQTEDFSKMNSGILASIDHQSASCPLLDTIIDQGCTMVDIYRTQTLDDIRRSKKYVLRYNGKPLVVFIGEFRHTSLAGQVIRDLNPDASTLMISVKFNFMNPLTVTLSFRSSGVMCRPLAERMGGGGHDMASGAIVYLAEHDTFKKLIEFIEIFVKDTADQNLF